QGAVDFFFKKVGEAFELLVKIGDIVLKSVIKTIENAASFIWTILTNCLKIAEEALVSVLSIIFPWEDIRKVHGFVTTTFLTTTEKLEKEVDKIFSSIESA